MSLDTISYIDADPGVDAPRPGIREFELEVHTFYNAIHAGEYPLYIPPINSVLLNQTCLSLYSSKVAPCLWPSGAGSTIKYPAGG
jgi:hypothetical protein